MHTSIGRLVDPQLFGQEGASMTPDDVRAAAKQLVEFHDRFANLFGKTQAQDHASSYLKGLMCCPERKSIEPIALTSVVRSSTRRVSGRMMKRTRPQ